VLAEETAPLARQGLSSPAGSVPGGATFMSASLCLLASVATLLFIILFFMSKSRVEKNLFQLRAPSTVSQPCTC